MLRLYGKRKSNPKVKSELRKQQYTVTLFDSRNGSLANGKIYVLLYTVFTLLYFEFEGNFPRGLYMEGRIS